MIHILRLIFIVVIGWLSCEVDGDLVDARRMAHYHHDRDDMRVKSMMRRLLRQPNHPWWTLMKDSVLHNSLLNDSMLMNGGGEETLPSPPLLDLETIDKLLGLLEEEALLDKAAGMRKAAGKRRPLTQSNITQRRIQMVQSSIWSTILITTIVFALLGFLVLSVRVFWVLRTECRQEDWSMRSLASYSGLSLIMHHYRHEMYGTALPPRKRFASSFHSFSSRSSTSADGFELLSETLPLWHRIWRWSISWVPGKSLTQPKNQMKLIEEMFPSQQQQHRGSVQGRKRMPSIRDHILNDGWHETNVSSNSNSRRPKASTTKRHSLPHVSSLTPEPVEKTMAPIETPVLTTLPSLTDQSDDSVYRHPDDQDIVDNPQFSLEEEAMLIETRIEDESPSEPSLPPSPLASVDFALPSPQPSPSPSMGSPFAIEHLDTAQDPIHVPSGRRSLPPLACNVAPMSSTTNSNSKLLRRLASHSPTAMDDLGQSKLARFFVQSPVQQRSIVHPVSPAIPHPPPPTPSGTSYDALYGGIPAGIFGRRAATPIPTPPPSRRPTPGCEMEQRLQDGDLTPPPGLVRRPQSIHHLSAEIFDDGRTSVADFFEQRRRLHQQQQQRTSNDVSGFGAVGARPRPY